MDSGLLASLGPGMTSVGAPRPLCVTGLTWTPNREPTMLFVVHALDKKDILPTRAKHYRDHRIHLDRAVEHGVDVVTAGTLVARRRRDAGRQHFCHRCDGPRRGRFVYAQRSLPRQRRVGTRLHPRLQQEARNADCEPALTGSPARRVRTWTATCPLLCLQRACSCRAPRCPRQSPDRSGDPAPG